jgi:hypothetical protein
MAEKRLEGRHLRREDAVPREYPRPFKKEMMG